MSLSLNLSNLIPEKKAVFKPQIKNGIAETAFNKISTRYFFVFLFLYQLIFIFQGVELSDEGFLSTFYQQIFSNPESVQYNFMFWLTGIIGGIYYKLFSFLGLWGLRLGGVLITTGTAMMAYRLLKNLLNENYLKLGLFLVIIALNNDIKEINYNNLSALIYVTIVYFLYHGLKDGLNSKLFISGVFVAVNVFIRPPNVLGTGLVLAILYYGFLNKQSIGVITRQTAIFFGGFLAACAILLLMIYAFGHWNIFINALQVVYKMSQGGQQVEAKDSHYGIAKLLYQLKSNNAKAIFISLSIIVGLILGITVLSSIKRKISIFHRLTRQMKYIFLFCILIMIFKGVIDPLSILFFYSGIVVLVFLFVLITPNDPEIKFLLFCGCFILISFPFGSSAGILTAGRYSFWIGLPISINYLFNIRTVKNLLVFHRGEQSSSFHIVITENQVRIAKNLFLVILIFAGVFQSFTYPFFDRRSRLKMTHSVNNENLRGIYTTKGRAEALDELLTASKPYVKKGTSVLAYDCIPLYHFLTESVPYIRSPYPWLYETAIFRSEMNLAALQNKPLPVVVMQKIKTIGNGSKWPEEALPEEYSLWDANQGRNDYMIAFLAANHYREVWQSPYFRILIPG